MYESYWQLTDKPFENHADPRFFYPGESHQAALLKLRYAVENRRGGALLAGASGTGKTLIVQMLGNLLSEEFSPLVHVVFPQMSTAELLGYLADELVGPSGGTHRAGVDQSVRRIEHFLADNSEQGRHAVVIVDEAHLVDDAATLEALRLLLNFQAAGRPGLTLLLVGQPGLLPVLDRTPQLEDRLGVKSLIRPLREQETAEYVSQRLQAAGARQPLFEPDALSVLHTLTHGVPRQVNRLCDLALLIGYAEQRRTITAGHLESVLSELVAVAPE